MRSKAGEPTYYVNLKALLTHLRKQHSDEAPHPAHAPAVITGLYRFGLHRFPNSHKYVLAHPDHSEKFVARNSYHKTSFNRDDWQSLDVLAYLSDAIITAVMK